jgi:hypothetical protein
MDEAVMAAPEGDEFVDSPTASDSPNEVGP